MSWFVPYLRRLTAWCVSANSSVDLVEISHRCVRAGYFALNVPAGLTIYWLTNNVLTTAQQVYLKKVTKIELPKATGTIVNPVVDVEASAASSGGTGASAGARRSRKGETFRARQVHHAAALLCPTACCFLHVC